MVSVAHVDTPAPAVPVRRAGRPRSQDAHQRILAAARDLLAVEGYADLRLEHVAARAGVGKATIYRRWRSKEDLVAELLADLAQPTIQVPDLGDTREELLAAVLTPMHALTDTDYGPVITALLSQITLNPAVGDPFRASVVRARRDEIARIVARGVDRGDLRPDTDAAVATEMLVGPVYYRLMFGGELTEEFAEQVVDTLMWGYAEPSSLS